MDNAYKSKSDPASPGHKELHWFSTGLVANEPCKERELSPIPYDLSYEQIQQIQINESLESALKRAPMTLRDCLRQKGENGVLSWINEFSELVDAVKRCRDDGNVFVSTYNQALATCETLLQLRTEIKNQLIIISFFSHVRRLKRIFDPETQKIDPALDFPFFEAGRMERRL